MIMCCGAQVGGERFLVLILTPAPNRPLTLSMDRSCASERWNLKSASPRDIRWVIASYMLPQLEFASAAISSSPVPLVAQIYQAAIGTSWRKVSKRKYLPCQMIRVCFQVMVPKRRWGRKRQVTRLWVACKLRYPFRDRKSTR